MNTNKEIIALNEQLIKTNEHLITANKNLLAITNELSNTKTVVRTLITWLFVELGDEAVKSLITKLE
jgi:hypothetical protein